ncbi:hypothetical protein [Gemmatimonas aurantiaca]|uniref:hypothetical protein n=1 Tax=Gemmatimonas aurantiaca TaxID=173480 RepID=UPI00301C4AF1
MGFRGFSDLANCVPTANSGALTPNRHVGFDWSNFFITDGQSTTALHPTGVGYTNGIITPWCVALNSLGEMPEISSATPFTFNDGNFTAAFPMIFPCTSPGSVARPSCSPARSS